MTGKVKGIVSGIKAVAAHISHVYCIVHRQHLAAESIGGDMEEALNAAMHAINFVKANSLNDRLFMQFCETEKFKTLLFYTKVRWLSKGLSLKIFVDLWEQVINFFKFKSQMADSNYKNKLVKLKKFWKNSRLLR